MDFHVSGNNHGYFYGDTMNKKKVVIYIGTLVISIWLSLLLILIFIEKVLLVAIRNSLIRSVLGISFYFIWLLSGYLILHGISSYFIRRNKARSSPKSC